MPFSAGIKGRDSNQAVNADFRFEIAERIFTTGREGSAFYAGFFSGLKIDQFQRIAFAFDPARIHSEQHLRPVLGLGTTGAGIYRDNGIFIIVFPIEHDLEGEPLAFLFEPDDLLYDFLQSFFVGFFQRQLQKYFVFFQRLFEPIKVVNFTRQRSTLFQDRFRILGVVPEPFLGDDRFDFR